MTVGIRCLILAVGLSLLSLQLSISPFWRPTHLTLGRCYLSSGCKCHIFHASLKPSADAYISAVHQLINLRREKCKNNYKKGALISAARIKKDNELLFFLNPLQYVWC